MPKLYVGRDNAGQEARSLTPQASGPFQHLLVDGPTIGLFYGYSGSVTGNVLYVVENGPTFGIQYSAT